MQHSFIRNRGETVSLFAKTNSQIEECLVYKIAEDDSFSPVTYVPSISEISQDLFKTDIILPSEDCILCVLFKKQPIVVIVGEPTRRFVYYRVVSGDNVPFEQFSYSGDPINSGTLTDLGIGFYMNTLLETYPSIIEVDNTPFPVKFPYSTIASVMNGNIKLQNDVWQLIAIPRMTTTVKEYFVDRLAAKYNLAAEDMIEICTAYFGDENKFRSYIPGITNPLTSNNFPLIYDDASSKEITGFWVKMKDLVGLVPDINNITLSWES